MTRRVTRSTRCNAIVYFVESVAVRCGQAEDHEAHDPKSGIDAHPFDSFPAERDGSWVYASEAER